MNPFYIFVFFVDKKSSRVHEVLTIDPILYFWLGSECLIRFERGVTYI